MKTNVIREWMGGIAGLGVLLIFGGIIMEMNKSVITTPKYYCVIISLLFWIFVSILCLFEVQESFFPQDISQILNKPYNFSYITICIGIASVLIFSFSLISVICHNDELTPSLRILTEEKNFCCIYINGKPEVDCGCYKYEGKVERTTGFFNRLTKGKKQIVHCDKCKLTTYKFGYIITQSVNVIASILIILLSMLHYTIEVQWFKLSSDERIQLDESKFVEEKSFFIQQLFAKKQKKE